MMPSDDEQRNAAFRKLFGKTGKTFKIIAPFFCDYGYNIEIGEKFFANTNLVILDEAKVKFGDNVLLRPIAPFTRLGMHSTQSKETKIFNIVILLLLAIMCGLAAT